MKQESLALDTEVKEHREAQRETIVFKTLRHAMNALAARGLRYVALFATIGLFCWASADPHGMRTINAGLFSLVFIVVLMRKDGGDGGE